MDGAVGSAVHSLDTVHDRAPELVEWLRTGRLSLLDETRRPVEADGWGDLSADVRARALDDFHRIVRGNAKAAVLFLR